MDVRPAVGFRPRAAARAVVLAAAGALVVGATVRGAGEAARPEAGKKRVAVVLSVGGLGDRSFNDMAYAGLVRAREELGVVGVHGEPHSMSEDERYLDFYADAGFDAVFAIGFLMKTSLEKAAARHPKTSFAIIDDVVDLPNVASVRFREHEGCFLVGALAGRKSRTGVGGIVLGMDIPLLRSFEHGWRQGFLAARPDGRVVSLVAGTFADPVKGKELALQEINDGADVVFQASGRTGVGVIAAAGERTTKDAPVYAVGCDANQNGERPGVVLTSMLKRVDVAVFEICREVVEGRFKPGLHSLGVKEGALGWALDEHNRPLVSAEDEAALRRFESEIASGARVVDAAAK